MRVRLPALLFMLVAVVAVACGGSDKETTAVTATPAASAAAVLATTAPPTAAPLTGNLNVFAAASLTDAFNEIGAELQKTNPNLKITFNFAASTALRTQIEQGAKADIYASADQVQMDNAKKSGVIDGEDRLFVKNKLVVIYPTSNPGKITAIKDLANPGLKFVLTDKNVPIGAYARTALEKMSADAQFGADFGQKVLNNLKSEEANVRAVVIKVQLGEADAAIVYASDVTPAVSKDVTAILIPDQFNTIATYPIAVVKDASNKAAAQGFIQYVRSSKGQEILKKWNFIVDKDTGMAWTPRTDPALTLLTVAQERRFSPSFRLEGGVARPGVYTLADLQTLPAEEVDVEYMAETGTQRHRYKGVRLHTFLMKAGPLIDQSIRNDALRWYARAGATDGYWAIVAWVEIDPGFENKPVLIAYEEDGQLLGEADGMARLVVPGDQRGGRYVSNLDTLSLLKAESPVTLSPVRSAHTGWPHAAASRGTDAAWTAPAGLRRGRAL